MRKNKKKAMGYVIILFFTAIIFTVGTVVLALVIGDFKARISESKKVENLYQSESGLDIAYNIIVKDSNMATVYAMNKVYDDYNGKPNASYEVVNKSFKENFIKFLSDDNTQAYNNIDNRLVNGINNMKYIIVDPAKKLDSQDERIAALVNLNSYITSDAELQANINNLKQSRKIEVTNFDRDLDNKILVVDLKSTFETINGIDGTKNKRVITTKYTIKAPDYNKQISENNLYQNVNTYSVEKGLFVDGNLSIKNSNVNIDGDLWVKGKSLQYGANPSYSFDKYENGISVEAATLSASNNVYTNNTFQLKNNATSIISGNLYSTNVYLGSGNNIVGSNNHLTVNNDLITNNDLTLDSGKSDITINNYYGIGDKQETKAAKANASRNSSSIIVNNLDKEAPLSTLKIANAYIYGLAYVDTYSDSYYETGESVSVIGNYKAYTDKVYGETGKVKFEEYPTDAATGTLEFIKSIQYGTSTPDESYIMKQNQFRNYFEDNSNTFENGGISIENLKCIGTGVNKNAIIPSNDILDMATKQQDKQKEFGRNVYGMGDNVNAMEYYNAGESTMKTVSNQVDFTKIGDDINIFANNPSSIKYGYAVLGQDTDGPIVIDGSNITLSYTNGTSTTVNATSIDPAYAGKIKAVIITKGDVIIKGNVDFVGCIIAGGDVSIEGGSVSIKYDSQVVNGIIANNFTYFDGLFSGISSASTQIQVGKNYDLPYSDGNTYDVNTYLRKGLWKLDK